jgi:hypothetical protein
VPRADIVFTTETQSTLGSEYFLSRTHLLRDLGDSAVSSLLDTIIAAEKFARAAEKFNYTNTTFGFCVGSVPGKCCLKLRLNIEINKKRSRRSEGH